MRPDERWDRRPLNYYAAARAEAARQAELVVVQRVHAATAAAREAVVQSVRYRRGVDAQATLAAMYEGARAAFRGFSGVMARLAAAVAPSAPPPGDRP